MLTNESGKVPRYKINIQKSLLQQKEYLGINFLKKAKADEWIRRLWYIYTMEYYSAIKKNAFE